MRLVAACLVGVSFAASALAAPPPLDPQAKDAYPWRVVLKTGKHPVFGATFREVLAREIRASLQGVTGPAAIVDVIDLAAIPPNQWDPLWTEFAAKGWAALDADPRRELSGVKTHVLTLDYKDGAFLLESRQHDGFTGLASPLVRKQQVRSAEMVGRAAGLMLEPDFGPTGTVEIEEGNTDTVKLVFRGHAIGSPERFVKIGDVFAVSIIKEMVKPSERGKPTSAPAKAGPPAGTPFEFTLLKALTPVKDGAIKCATLSQYKLPFGRADKRTLGVRAMRLPTIESQVKLRLVGQDGTPHAKGTLVQVSATDIDFAAKPGPQDGFEFRDGLYKSGRAYANIACVQIALGAGNPRLFPVAIVGDEPVTLKFAIKPEDEKRAAFETTCNDLRRRVGDTFTAQTSLFKEVSRLIDIFQFKDALGRSEAGFANTDKLEKTLNDELKQLREEPEAGQPTAKAILDESERVMKSVAESQGSLTKRVAELKEAVKKNADPVRMAKEFREIELASRIKDLVKRGDIPEALDAYDQLIVLQPAAQELKDQREKLQAEWAPKDEEHRKGRAAMKPWTDARAQSDFKEAIPAMKLAADVMYKKRDRLGLLKLLNLFEPGYTSLKILVDALDARTEDGEAQAKELQSLIEDAKRVELEARDYLKQLPAPTPETK